MILRSTRRVAEALGFLIAGLIVLGVLLAWRLSAGPITADSLTPVLEAALSRGPYRVEIGTTLIRWGGFDRPLGLEATAVTVRDPDGTLIAALPELAMGLSAPALLRGAVEPTRLELIEPRLRVSRDAGGDFHFALGIGASTASTENQEDRAGTPAATGDAPGPGHDLVAWMLAGLASAPGSGHPMAGLRRISVLRAQITYDDRNLGVLWRAPAADVALWRSGDGIRGALRLMVVMAGRPTSLEATAVRAAGGRIDADLRIADLPPAALAELDARLAPLRVLPGPVGLWSALRLGPDLMPERIDFRLTGGAGRLDMDALFPRPVTIGGLELAGSIDLPARRLHVEQAQIELGGPRITARGTATEAAGRVRIEAEATVSGLPVDLLDSYWPNSAGRGARRWVTRNLARGMVRSATARLRADAPAGDPAALAVAAFDGSMAFDGLQVTYLDGLPPVTGVAGTAAFDRHSLIVDVTGGRLRDLTVPEARIAITGLDESAPEPIDIGVVVSGPLRTVLDVLDSPRLHFIADLGLDPAAVSGVQSSRLRFLFRLKNHLPIEEVAIAVAANLRTAGLGRVARGIGVGGIDAALRLDGQGMTVEGTALAGGLPVGFAWTERFNRGRDFLTRLVLSGRIDETAAATLGLPPIPGVTGPVGIEATYTDLDRTRQTLAATLDLTPTALAIEDLAWAKPAGAPARAQIDLTLRNDVPQRIPAFRIDAPDLLARGAATLGEGGDLAELTIGEFVQGGTRLAIRAERQPAGGYRIAVAGPRLEASRLIELHLSGDAAGRTAAEGGPPLHLTLDLGEVALGRGRSLFAVNGHAARSAEGWTTLDLAARTGGTGHLRATLEPVGPNVVQYRLRADDAGAVLRGLDLLSDMEGGTLTLTGVRQGPPGARQYGGSVRLDEFRMIGAPVLARLLAATSVGGLSDALTGEGLAFRRLVADYRLDGDLLTLMDGRTSGGALGLTFAGRIDTAADRLDLEGTVVPVYEVNRVIGAIPLVGRLLTGGEGQGVFAFTYGLRGPVGEPTVSVNPLAVLAPGVLRNLFFLDGLDPAAEDGGLPPADPAVSQRPQSQ